MRIIKSLGLILLSLAGVAASAQTFMVDGINYNVLSEEEGTVEVVSEYYFGDIVIPAEVSHDGGTYRVTTIGDRAFHTCSDLTSISMPSVTTIGDNAFDDCYALTSVDMPSVITIGNAAFCGCLALTSAEMPEATMIGDSAFYNCSDLTSIEMPKATTIGDEAFNYCDGLTSVSMPLVATIGEEAFFRCSALTSVEMPAAETIGNGAFYYCDGLTSVSMPEVRTIDDGAFFKCSALTSVEMPAVTTINDAAFANCTALTSVSMPEVTTIGIEAFTFCSALTSVEMPAVETISHQAFGGCSALAYIHLPASCTSVFYNPFVACKSLREITVDENNPDYTSVDGVLYDKNVETLLACPGSKSFIDIPSSVTTIDVYAFGECSALTSVEMPAVTTIGEYAFGGCSALTSVDIPASVTMIGEGAFTYCDALTAVYCHWDEPLECEPFFTDEVIANATLYVPTGSIDAYESVYPWGKFINIEEKDYSGIADATASEVTIKVIDGAITVEGGVGMASAPVVEVYSAGGGCVYRGTDSSIGGLGHGIYVVKVGGTVQKVAL